MDEQAYAYCAGVVDSDGYIGIVKKNGKQCTARLAVVQASEGATTFFYKLFGVGCRYVRPPRRNSNLIGRRKLYGWSADCASVVPVLQKLLPYLRIKKRQAKLALEFQAIKGLPLKERRMVGTEIIETRNRWGWYKRRRIVPRPEIEEALEKLRGKVAWLNAHPDSLG